MKGIDVSAHNGAICWQSVRADGIEFAILRAGYGRHPKQKDARFEENYTAATAAGIPLGAYWYSYATTVAEAEQEAAVCISMLRGKQFAFPIYFDLEEAAALATGKGNCSAMVRAFCNALEQAGYWAGFYTSRSVLSSHIDDTIKTRYALWAAEWGEKLHYNGTVGIWQHSERGAVRGISGNVDLDLCYIDYPARIRAKGLNGFESAESLPTPPAMSEEIPVTLTVSGTTYSGTLKQT